MRIVPDYLPASIGATLFTLALILALSPYLAGADLGIFKIPALSDRLKSALKWYGPVFLLLTILIHLPIGKGRYKTCRLPEFGVERWNNEEVITKKSGWRGGGSNQETWCSELKNQIVAVRSLGSDYKIEVIKSSEDGRFTGLRHKEYNYTCSIKLHWNPIYNQKADPRCGNAE